MPLHAKVQKIQYLDPRYLTLLHRHLLLKLIKLLDSRLLNRTQLAEMLHLVEVESMNHIIWRQLLHLLIHRAKKRKLLFRRISSRNQVSSCSKTSKLMALLQIIISQVSTMSKRINRKTLQLTIKMLWKSKQWKIARSLLCHFYLKPWTIFRIFICSKHFIFLNSNFKVLMMKTWKRKLHI